MKTRILIIGLFIMFAAQSCDKQLEIDPIDGLGPETLYKDDAGALAGLIGVYSRLVLAYREANINASYPSAGTDEGFENRGENRSYLEYSYSTNNSDVLQSWALLYEGVYAANTLIKELNESEGVSASGKTILTAEARFLRAYLLMDLQRAFGGLKGVPMPTDETIKELLPRTPGTEVYAQIFTDLEAAVEGLPEIADATPGRASKAAAQALLARAYLYRAGLPFTNDGDYYTKARDWAKKVMDNGYQELNPSYGDVFEKLAKEQYDPKEVLFQVGYFSGNSNQLQNSKLGSAIGFRIDDSGCGNRGFSLISVPITMTDEYRRDSTDERGLWNVSPFFIPTRNNCEFQTITNQITYYASKYRRYFEVNGNSSYGPHHFPVMRYSDVLLMYAEAENMVNPGSAESLAAVNQVRNRAKATPLAGPITLDSIQAERRLELCFEGVRRYDLIRWGILQQKITESMLAMRAADGSVNTDWPKYGTGDPEVRTNSIQEHYFDSYINFEDGKHQLLPIPEQEMGANDLVTQNARW